ncbi:MAG: hypothetical protein WC460_01375 [Patescibacteria group bacterium]
MKIQLELSPEAIKFLDLLQEKMGFASKAETIRYVFDILKSGWGWKDANISELASNFQVEQKVPN